MIFSCSIGFISLHVRTSCLYVCQRERILHFDLTLAIEAEERDTKSLDIFWLSSKQVDIVRRFQANALSPLRRAQILYTFTISMKKHFCEIKKKKRKRNRIRIKFLSFLGSFITRVLLFLLLQQIQDINCQVAQFRDLLINVGQPRDCPELREKIRKLRRSCVEACKGTSQLVLPQVRSQLFVVTIVVVVVGHPTSSELEVVEMRIKRHFEG
ncbi:regulator of G-protein signaling 7-binding protein-like isoform X1 [Vespula maculifrons]|uniref:Regulator of G-protein signaling 7-binding protein-like isoform X1 n=1 Tax=Vespula maculifrons TaxID=7453 RepID=A0ABD2BFY6_VESMC